MIKLDDFLSMTQAAVELGVTRQRMHQLVSSYSVPTFELGNQKAIRRADLSQIPADRPSGKRKTERKKPRNKK